ncbi:MmyB family transcriptional regulator [Peribacillus frigoritolerans]
MNPPLQNFLNQLEVPPAYVIDERMNAVAWNEAFSINLYYKKGL